MEATLFTDGGARGNPGPAAGGAVLIDAGGEIIDRIGEYIGITTNNVAEWHALCVGLAAARDRGIRTLAVRMDSELVVKQLRGEYRVKREHLQPFYRKATALMRSFDHVDVAHVPRAKNRLADRVVNEVLDAHARSEAEASQ
ncbi:MAG: ribonuclease HI family protein [Candidatus Tyrphobacter sp.]